MLTIDESRVAMKTPTATMPSTSHWLGAASCRSVITRIVYYNCSAARSRSLKAETPPTPSRRGWDDLEEAIPIGPGPAGSLLRGSPKVSVPFLTSGGPSLIEYLMVQLVNCAPSSNLWTLRRYGWPKCWAALLGSVKCSGPYPLVTSMS